MLKMHEEWMAQHGRVYKDADEKQKRYLVFKDNVQRVTEPREAPVTQRIEAFNNGVDRGYKLGLNKFADLTDEEFRTMHHGYKRPASSKLMSSSSKSTSFRYRNFTAVPATLDWRKAGVVTPVKDQGSCEQELVDCDTAGGNEGCEGGLMDNAFQYILNQGLSSEANYPYKGSDSICNRKKAATPAAKITGTYLDHAVTAIGYGTSKDGSKYWLLKNSWAQAGARVGI
ncbi:hypothetical protein GH714_012925 [Hevea brasiliensis]|uniref:Cathepsin propeptide inhibitor domain-containing protein n=1 Tax=Hevea brasiliensis TaxID=3981 RepID=A0A6A6LRA2_HEVBR|nr:hypothetical protein GH714_012925 [Hevea brasiliensis]